MKEFEDEDVIKLTLLYFMEHVLFGKEEENLILWLIIWRILTNIHGGDLL